MCRLLFFCLIVAKQIFVCGQFSQMSDEKKAEAPKEAVKEVSKALVFYATGKANDKGELNYYQFVDFCPKDSLATLQGIVGGNIEGIPNTKQKVSFEAYANENGFNEFYDHKPGIGRNDLAGGVLHSLGFWTSSIGPFCLAGNVVVVGQKDHGLNKKQQVVLEKAIKKWYDEYDK